MRATGLIMLLVSSVLLPQMTGCETNKATGKSQFAALSRDQEIALGTEAQPGLTEQYGGEVQDAQLRAYLDRIGAELAAETEGDNPSLPWEFTMLDSDVINAFALPGGKIFMSRGLVERMSNEAQFASVVGHEIGHVTARHINDKVATSTGLQLLMQGVSLGVGYSNAAWAADAAQMVVGYGGQGFLLKFSRDDELEADALGIRYMVKRGYDPAGARQVQQILADAAGAGGTAEILSTHPASQTRIDRIDELLQGEYAYTQNNPEFGLFEQRFRQECLSRMAALPKRDGRIPIGAFAMHNPALWCALCADGQTAQAQ